MLFPNNRIIVLSDTVRSGKTTALYNWLQSLQSKAGFICPDIGDSRKLLDLQTGIYYDLETNENHEDCVSIGKFHFSKRIINKASLAVLQALKTDVQFLVMDEIGKLEIESDEGFFPILKEVIACYENQRNGYLILVIRDSLLHKAINKFNLQNIPILNLQGFLEATRIHGLVLAGGNSSRMGFPKGLITYHTMAQQDKLYYDLKTYCENVFLSLKNNSIQTNPRNLPCLSDDIDYPEMGPMNGFISALNKNPLCNWIVIACDYPFLKIADIELLVKHSAAVNTSVCFGIEKQFEPLLAVYHLNDFNQFWKMLQSGNQSLRKFQNYIQPQVLTPVNRTTLFSADTPADLKEAKLKL
jgi:molybdopterin-guanine dinucleotide biosynthesis protein A